MNSSFTNQDDPVAAKAAEEAAMWLARLNSRVVDTAELEQFFAWRRIPHNAIAYDALDSHWTASLSLADDPEIESALRSALDVRKIPARSVGRRLAMVAGFAVFLAAAVFLLLARDPVLETATGEQRLVQLDDGSRVRLDTDTRMSVNIGSRRMIHLHQGRAFFEVAHDPSRPFVVAVGDAQVRALGTKFEIDGVGANVQVALVEGRVDVSAKSTRNTPRSVQLGPGEAITVSRNGPGKVVPADISAITAWTQGRLDFHGTPLAEAVSEVNRYARTPIRLKTKRWAEQRVNGGFAVGDVQAFIEAVTTLYPLNAVTNKDGSIELHDG